MLVVPRLSITPKKSGHYPKERAHFFRVMESLGKFNDWTCLARESLATKLTQGTNFNINQGANLVNTELLFSI